LASFAVVCWEESTMRSRLSHPFSFRACWIALLVCAAIQGLWPLPAAAQAPSLAAFTSCAAGGADCNLCLPNVTSSFNNLRDHGDILGFWLNGVSTDVCFGLSCSHWQGIQRIPSGSGQTLVISRSGSTMFNTVLMGSRNATGARFRSNRLNPSLFFHQTAPPSTDRIVGAWANDPGFSHAGGMQQLGNYLAVPVEASSSKVIMFDMASLTRLYDVPHTESSEAGTASLAKLADGRFLLTIGRTDAATLDFYVSTSTNLAATTFTPFDSWSRSETLTTIGDATFGDYQSLNFVHQCDGALFLIGTHENSSIGIGSDFADLFRVENGLGNDVRITKVAKKHLYCSYPSPGASSSQDNHCNFDAAGGVYVDPSRNLILYGTEHGHDGPSGTTRFMEFRSTFPNPNCSVDINEAFVELYDDSDFSDRGLMIDFPDQSLENYANYDQTEGFEDKASAVRFCIPPGWRYRLYQDKNYSGSFRDLVGSGSINLGSAGFGDKTSSSRWLNF
jgi:hypothetical protein